MKKIWTPKYSFQEVSEKVENIRKENEELQSIPVDIDAWLEFKLKLDIVPFHNLRERIGAEAMISRDYTTIYVDNDTFLNEKQWNRIKFSIAHEIGHMILHREFFDEQKIKTHEEWVQFMLEIQLKYAFLENHANWFAGILLVPAEPLLKELKKKNKPTLAKLTRIFEVSTQTIRKRLVADDIINTLTQEKEI